MDVKLKVQVCTCVGVYECMSWDVAGYLPAFVGVRAGKNSASEFNLPEFLHSELLHSSRCPCPAGGINTLSKLQYNHGVPAG